MRLLPTSGLLLACIAWSTAAVVTEQKNQKSRTSFVAQSRDGAGHSHGSGGGLGGGGAGGGGYGAPAAHSTNYGPSPPAYEEPAKDTGYYYYYYPVVPEKGGKKKGIFSSGKGFFGKMMETIMYPIMYPIMRMYDYLDGRALTSRAADYLPMQLIDKISLMIEEEVYKEECLSRIICQLGKSAEGYDTFINLSDFFVPEEYQSHLRTFKDSALKKTNCGLKFKCQSMEPSNKS